MALAEDHRNVGAQACPCCTSACYMRAESTLCQDVLSNAAAILCGVGASLSRKCWWIDPLGGILVSLYIIWSWVVICMGQASLRSCSSLPPMPCLLVLRLCLQIEKIVGIAAPEDFVEELEHLAGAAEQDACCLLGMHL